jgi:hypothetical protein
MLQLFVAALILASRPLDIVVRGHRAKTQPIYESALAPNRELVDDEYLPMRIQPFYSALHSSLTMEQEGFLKETLIPAAAEFWGQFLHVKPVSSITIPEDLLKCYDAIIPDDHKSSGVTGADFVMYVTADSTSHCDESSGSDTLAYAGVCVTEISTDRPIIGFANFCPQHINILGENRDYQVDSTVVILLTHLFFV